jgi:hypothetical protein
MERIKAMGTRKPKLLACRRRDAVKRSQPVATAKRKSSATHKQPRYVDHQWTDYFLRKKYCGY